MTMFTKISLHNFQCHKTLDLELEKITTLVGPSDSGKTAVLRAIDWVCYNKGRTALLLRRGAEDVTVRLDVDGHTITRSTKNNSYQFNEQLFSTIGRVMPAEIVSFLKMTDDNVQRQHDYLYWFAQNGAGVVSNLNKLVDLTKLEAWVKTGMAFDRQFKERETYLTVRNEELTVQENSLKPYEALNPVLAALESAYAVIGQKTKILTELTDLTTQYHTTEEQCSVMADFVADLTSLSQSWDHLCQVKKTIDGLSKIIASLETTQARITALTELCSKPIDFQELIDLRTKLAGIRKCVTGLAAIDESPLPNFSWDLTALLTGWDTVLSKRQHLTDLTALYRAATKPLPPSPDALLDRLTELEQDAEKYHALQKILDDIGRTDINIASKRREIEAQKTELKTIWNGVCPVCGKTLGEEEWTGHF